MTRLFPLMLLLFVVTNSHSQNIHFFESKTFTASVIKTVDLSLVSDSNEVTLTPFFEAPEHDAGLNRLKAPLDEARSKWLKEHAPDRVESLRKKGNTAPVIENNFAGNNLSGIPNDNNIAISNAGIIVSVVNTNLRVYDEDGKILLGRSLSAFTTGIGTISAPFDPHVLYDPQADKFILVFLNGFDHANTDIVIGFSSGNDPTKEWNFYKLPGNIHGDTTWSDYPFIGVSTKELFITVLQWKDGETGWDSEATNEVIWQIDKEKGYAGDSLQYKYYDQIKIAGRQVWNTRPVVGGTTPYGPNMYFLANRAIDMQNDSIFLFEITNTLASGQAQLSTTILKTPVPYGIPPSAIQKGTTDVLRTNYADIHSAFYQNGMIQFVGNSINKPTMSPGIYYGQIHDPGNNPTVTAHIIASDTLDFNYPSIAYAGAGGWDNSSLINCLHVSQTTFPGTSVFYTDGNGSFSPPVRVKEGEGLIEVLNDTIERWGDYTGIQAKYNETGVCWIAGSFGRPNSQYPATWIARIKNTDPITGNSHIQLDRTFEVYPNPAGQLVNVKLSFDNPQVIHFELVDAQGRSVADIPSQSVPAGTFEAKLSTGSLKQGVYLLRMLNDHSLLSTKKIVVEKN